MEVVGMVVPSEVLMTVLDFLAPADCLRAAATCRLWRALVECNMGRWSADAVRPVLLRAVSNGHTGCLRFVLTSCGFGTRIRFRAEFEDRECFVVSVACWRGHAEVLSVLLDHGAMVDQKAFMAAGELGRIDMLERLIAYANAHAPNTMREYWRERALLSAAEAGHVDVLRFLCEQHNTGEKLEFAVRSAVKKGRLDCVIYLCECDATQPRSDSTALKLILQALRHDQFPCFVYLYQRYRLPIVERCHRERLIVRADSGVIKQLIKAGFEFGEEDVEIALKHQRFLTLLAMVTTIRSLSGWSERLDEKEALVEWCQRRRGFSFDGGATASVAAEGQLECLRLLHDSNVPWDARTTFQAAANGYLDCLRYAHQCGAPWKSGAVRAAAEGDHMECLEYALANGCPLPRGRQVRRMQNLRCQARMNEEEARRREMIDKHLAQVQGKLFVLVETWSKAKEAKPVTCQVVGRTKRFVRARAIDIENQENDRDDKGQVCQNTSSLGKHHHRPLLFQLEIDKESNQYVLRTANRGTRAVMLRS